VGEVCCLCDVVIGTEPGQQPVKSWYTGSDWICGGCAARIVEAWMTRRQLAALERELEALAAREVAHD